MKDTYAGNIKNSGSQAVDAIYPQDKTKKGKVIKGDDLRANPSKVKNTK